MESHDNRIIEDLQLKLKEQQRIISNITEAFNIVYMVNMADDTFQQLRMDDFIVGSDKKFECFTQAKTYFIEEILHPSDKELLRRELDYGNIRRRLAETKNYNVEYRALLNGATVWHEMNITFIDTDLIAVSFVEEDKRILLRHLNKKRYDDYFALCVVDIRTGMVKTMKASPWYKMPPIGKAVPYKATMEAFASALEGEPRAFFHKLSDIEFVKRELATEDKRTYSYKSNIVEGQKWVVATSYVTCRNEDNTPAEFTLSFSIADSLDTRTKEIQQQIREDMQMISGLASEYHALYYFNIKEKTFKVYSLDREKFPEIGQMVSHGGDPLEVFRTFGKSDSVHPEDKHLFEDITVASVCEKLAHSKKISYRFRRRFGTQYLWTQLDLIKYEADDEPANVIAAGFAERDKEIRREQEHQKQLEKAYKAAESANRSKTSFLFNMSHDIRTPLNAINGFTAMAKKNLGNRERLNDYLDKIELSGQQLLILINQVLEMSRIESGKIDFDEKPVKVTDSYDALVTILSEQAKVNGLNFFHSINDIRHNDVLADIARMSQITLNITGNAIKYTPKGGSIDMRLCENPCPHEGFASFTFTVIDTGIGMSRDYLKVLYERFSREKNSTVSKIQGSGLGMSIVKSLVDLLGGRIEVQSEVGKGTRFDVTIELKINDKVVTEKPAQEAAQHVDFTGKRVLLVEDNELNREIARFIFEDLGLTVEEADDGIVAVNMLIDQFDKGIYNRYDCILMDIQMPVMNGYDATRAIRNIPFPKDVHVPIIAMTANVFEEDRQNAFAAGMDGHLSKPIDVAQLTEILSRFL